MSKVLIDRELLERAVSIPTKESLEANQAAIVDRGRAQSDIRELLAQPAEVEWVGKWSGLQLAAKVAEEDGPWEPRLGMTNVETAFAQSASPTKVLELIAALSAVTAERDQSISLTADYIAMLGEAGLELDQLRDVISYPLHGLREAWAFWRVCKADLSSRDTGAWGDAQSWLTDELHQLFETGPYEKSPQ